MRYTGKPHPGFMNIEDEMGCRVRLLSEAQFCRIQLFAYELHARQ